MMVEKVNQSEELSEFDVLKEEIKPELSALEEEVLSNTEEPEKELTPEEYKKLLSENVLVIKEEV